MSYAKIVGFSESIEEEVTLDINGNVFTVFASACPYEVFINNKYPIKLYASIFGEPIYKESNSSQIGLRRIDDTYSYVICGKVCRDGSLDVGDDIRIYPGELFEGSAYLIGKYFELKVDRLDVEFL